MLGRCREAGTTPVSTLARRLHWTPNLRAIVVDGATSPNLGALQVLRLDGNARGAVTLVLDVVRATVPAPPLEPKRTTTVPAATSASPTATVSPVASTRVEPNDRRVAPAPPGTLQRALLVLDSAPSTDALAGPVDVEVAEVVEGWDRDDGEVGLRRLPRTRAPLPLARLPVAPGMPLSIDVTEIVRGWTEPRAHRGLVVTLRPHAGTRATLSLLEADHPSPRLDLYLAPTDAELGPRPASGSTGAIEAGDAEPKRSTSARDGLEGEDE